jgi:putative spermidine/putrescine transport system substrate-binding protein
MGHSWNGRIYDIQQERVPVEIVWNEFALTSDFFVVPKGSKYVAEAMKFIGYAVSAENNAAVTSTAYALPNPALPNVDPNKKNDLATTYTDKALFFDDEWWDKNYTTVDQRFQEWLQA